jgi:putative ABC transport system permease protein
MALFLRLAVRNLMRHPWRTTATVVGVALGIASVLATLSVGDNVEANVRSTLEAAAGKAALLVTPGAQGRAVFDLATVTGPIEAHPEVAAWYPVLNFRAEPIREIEAFEASVIPGVDSGFQLSGRRTDVPDDLPTRVVSGNLPVPGSYGIALSETFADSRAIAIGDDLGFATRFGEVAFSVVGLLDGSLGLATTNGGRVGVVALADLQEAIRLEGRVSFVELLLDDGADLDAVRFSLEDDLGEAFAVVAPAVSGTFTIGLVETLQAGLSVLAVTLMALGGFMAYNTFAAGALERQREYALLRTIALTRGDVQRLALLEAAMISLLGVAVGVLLGVALAYGITRVNAIGLGFEFRRLVLPFDSVLIAALVGSVVALIAGALPARAASRTPPIVAGRAADTDSDGGGAPLGYLLIVAAIVSTLLPWSGLAALFGTALSMGLFFLGVTLASASLLRPAVALFRWPLVRLFGTEAKLGLGLAGRNGTRNGVAIGTVIMSTGLIIGVGAMVAGINRSIRDWVDTTVVGDLFVTSPVSFPPGFEGEAGAVVGIDVVSGVGLRAVRFEPSEGERGRTVAVVLVDAERFHPDSGFGSFQFTPGQGDGAEAYAALRDGGRVLAANTILERFGVGTGDIAKLRTADGFVDFDVAGVIVDFTGGGEAFIAGMADLERFGGGSPDLYVMTLDEGADPETARDRLMAAFPDLFLDVTLNDAYQQQILDITQRSFVTTNALLLLAVFIAALGVANTLGMSLSQRRHEIAVLRTVGLTRAGVRRLVLVEGIVVVSVGAVLGVGFGLLLSRIITAGASALTGFALTAQTPWQVVALALVLAPPLGIVASLLPARRAAKTSPMLALGAEE